MHSHESIDPIHVEQVQNERNFAFLANFLATFAANMPYKREFEVVLACFDLLIARLL